MRKKIKMIEKIAKKIIERSENKKAKKIKKAEERIRIDKMKMSVSCPFCKEYYSSSDIYKEENKVDIENITSIFCRKCDGVFLVEYKLFVHIGESWRTEIGIRENKNYDNN